MVAWYENDGSYPPVFESHIVSTTAIACYSVFATDLNSDDRMDILAASRTGNKIEWFENRGTSPPSFIAHYVTSTVNGARAVYAVDLDHDSDLDVITALYDGDRSYVVHGNNGGIIPFIWQPIRFHLQLLMQLMFLQRIWIKMEISMSFLLQRMRTKSLGMRIMAYDPPEFVATHYYNKCQWRYPEFLREILMATGVLTFSLPHRYRQLDPLV